MTSTPFTQKPTAKIAAVIAAVVTVLSLGIGDANAASAGWGPNYDVNGDGCTDISLYYNSAGRVTQAYLKLGRGCRWDTLARDTDQNGTFDETGTTRKHRAGRGTPCCSPTSSSPTRVRIIGTTTIRTGRSGGSCARSQPPPGRLRTGPWVASTARSWHCPDLPDTSPIDHRR